MANKSEETRPRRKWSDREVTLILDYLIENKNFEMPTAQSYYRKLIEQQKISPSWNLIRWKVRYLKKCYLKTKNWRYSRDGVEMEKAEGAFSMRDRMVKICPFYNKLEQIFGEEFEANQTQLNEFNFSYIEVDTKPCMNEDSNCLAVLNESSADADTLALSTKYSQHGQEQSQQTKQEPLLASDDQDDESPMINEDDFFMNNRNHLQFSPKDGDGELIECLTTMQTQLMKSEREILKFKRKKLKIFKKVEKQKIRLEKHKLKVALEWQNKLFELRKEELESREKMARLELELKYNAEKS